MTDKDVKLKISSEADTSGFKDVNDSLAALKKRTDDALKSQRELGKEMGDTGSTPQQEVVDPQLNEQMSKVLRIQYAGMARDIGQGISSIARALQDTAKASALADPELSKTLSNTAVGLDSLSMGLNTAAQGFAVGGPLGGAIGGLVGLMAGPLKSAFNDYQQALIDSGNAQVAAAASVERLKQVRAEFAAQIKSERLQDHYRDELNLIEDTIAAIERRAKILQAERSLDTTQRESTQRQTARDPNQSFAQREVADVGGDFSDAEKAITDAIKTMAAKAEEMANQASQLEFKAGELASANNSATEAEVRAANDAATEARQAADQAAANVEAETAAAEIKIKQLIIGFSDRLGDAAESVQKEAASEAQTVIDQIMAGGQALTAQQQLAAQSAQKILEDGRVTAQEQQKLQQNLSTLILGWKTDITQVQTVLTEANKITGSLATGLSAIKAEQQRLQQQVNQLSSR